MAEKSDNENCGSFAGTAENSFLSSYLDVVDSRIEDLRRQAAELLQERESLLTVLSQLEEETCVADRNDESQDHLATIERLRQRCEAIDIKVHTVRSPEQELAFSKVKTLIEELEHVCIFEDVEDDPDSYRQRAQCLLNACTSEPAQNGPIDYKFQSMILGCKLEDQKLVRHRLECLVEGRCHENFMEAHIGQEKQPQPVDCYDTNSSAS
ncbi:Bag family molecular chaperone regulator 2 [Plakobranchus ocellatus]|uniref:Bag family molecular chaperone regulator 2 n=1 Tax=Plakobranchus ocellatus TaxID=259542 RepID=A0AAV4AYE5_9GAST|nr:Bag family molecular chaperone regulator 2 [Plakobranchus ocellatus]